MNNKTLKSRNPINDLTQYFSNLYNSTEKIWVEDRDDLIEDTTKLASIWIMVKLASYIKYNLLYTTPIVYIIANEIGDKLGELVDIDDKNKNTKREKSFTEYTDSLLSDIVEDTSKILLLSWYWLTAWGLPEITNTYINNLIPKEIILIGSYSYAIFKTLEEYSKINEKSNSYGNWAEEEFNKFIGWDSHTNSIDYEL